MRSIALRAARVQGWVSLPSAGCRRAAWTGSVRRTKGGVRVDGEVLTGRSGRRRAYRFGLFGDRFTCTNAAFALSDGGARKYRTGRARDVGAPGAPGFEVNLDARCREAASAAAAAEVAPFQPTRRKP